jgi:hypothetical protein
MMRTRLLLGALVLALVGVAVSLMARGRAGGAHSSSPTVATGFSATLPDGFALPPDSIPVDSDSRAFAEREHIPPLVWGNLRGMNHALGDVIRRAQKDGELPDHPVSKFVAEQEKLMLEMLRDPAKVGRYHEFVRSHTPPVATFKAADGKVYEAYEYK